MNHGEDASSEYSAAEEIRRLKAELNNYEEQAHFIRSITELIPDVVTVVELPSRKIIYSSRDTMTLLGFDPEEIINMSFAERSNLFHPDDLPHIQAFYERFAQLDECKENTVLYRLKNKKGDWVHLSVRGKVFKRDTHGNVTQAVFIGQDVTARKKAEEELRRSHELFQSTVNSVQDRLHVMEAVRNPQGEIIDFRWLLMNTIAKERFGDYTGKLLREHHPGVLQEGIFEAFKQVTETGLPQHYEKHYKHEGIDVWVQQTVVKLNDGIVNTTKDITESKKAEREMKEARELLQSISDVSLASIACYKAIRNKQGEIVDFEYLFQNQAKRQNYGGKNLVGQRMSDLDKNSRIFRSFVKTVETGEAQTFEEYHAHEGFHGWYRVVVVKLDDGVVTSTEDITSSKKAEQEIMRLKDEVAQKATDKYLTLFNSIDAGLCIIEVLFDENGEGMDYRFLEANPAFVRQTSLQDAIGRTVKSMVPRHEDFWYKVYGEVAKTREPKRFEHFASQLLGGTWYDVYAFPVDAPGKHRVAVLFNDVTERKNMEQRKDLLLKLSDALRSAADPVAKQSIAVDLLGEYLQVSLAHYGEVTGEHVHIAHSYANGLPPMKGRFRHLDFGKRLVEGLRSGKVQVCSDVTTDPAISETERAVLGAAHIGAYVAVPLVKAGEWVSVLAVHSIMPRTWKQVEIDLVQETAERTWAAVERTKVEEALRESDAWINGQKEAFQAAMSGQPLSTSLEVLIRTVTRQTGDEARAAFYMIPPDSKGLHLVAGMSKAFAHDIKKVSLDAGSLTCCLATHTGEPVITPDIQTDPLCDGWRQLARKFDYRSCWSFPVHAVGGPVLGTFAMYFRQPRRPTARELELAGVVTHAAAIIMSRNTELVERTQAETALRESEERFRNLVESYAQAVWETNAAGEVVSDSPSWRAFTGQSYEERLGYGWLNAIYHEDRAYAEREWRESIVAKKNVNAEFRLKLAGNDFRWTNVRATPLLNDQGTIIKWTAMNIDIHEKHLAEERLKELNESLERRVEQRTNELIRLKLKQEKEKLNAVIFAQEQERTRIGEGLHNGVAQLLYAVQNKLQLLDPGNGKDRKTLDSAGEILKDAINDLRRNSFELMPPVLRDYGLGVALQTLIKKIFTERTDVMLNLSFKKRAPEELEISIYRVLQEILNNIIKHAHASKVSLDLYEEDQALIIKIRDNGTGFSVKTTERLRKGIGLQAIRNRVMLLDGQVRFSSRSGKGTTVTVRVPLT